MVLLKRQRHHRVYSKVLEVLDAVDHIQNLADSMWTDVVALVVAGIEHADVKLVDDQIVERRWTKSLITPDIRTRIAHDAVARIPRVAAHLELTRVGIAFEAFAALANYVESIKITVLDAGEVAGPVPIRVLHEQLIRIL